jgi:hypothetical protein
MRLLNAVTLQLEEFFDTDLPPYAILSHRWQDDEVSFQHIQDGSGPRKKGYAKLKLCCDQAVKDGYTHAWVDTCCIDKSSSAELTEAINSMFQWYQKAVVCYAYLFDVGKSEISPRENFAESAWWTRGWTLQELIAPSRVEFYSSTWNNLGSKESLKRRISEITRIDIQALGGKDLNSFSIGKKMSWASKRTTTRVEDVAYSLLGIFQVNMPLLYGEGNRAFKRLQEEIIKQSDDHSIFAWRFSQSPNHDHSLTEYRGLLAESPAAFSKSSNIVRSGLKLGRAPYSVTNMGLAIELFMTPWAMETYLAILDCGVDGHSDGRIGIFLRLLPEKDQYARVRVDYEDVMTFPPELLSEGTYIKVYVRQEWRFAPLVDQLYGFWVRSVHSTTSDETTSRNEHTLTKVHSHNEWSNHKRILEIPVGSRGTAGVLWYSSTNLGDSTLKLGFDTSFNPVCLLEGPLEEGVPSKLAPEVRSSFNIMDPSWMDIPLLNVHKGSRLKGLCKYSGSRKFSIKWERVENQRMWVVDIERYNSKDPLWDGVSCDGCKIEVRYVLVAPFTSIIVFMLIEQQNIYGPRYMCTTCPNFDYCSNCVLNSDTSHPSHAFMEMEK